MACRGQPNLLRFHNPVIALLFCLLSLNCQHVALGARILSVTFISSKSSMITFDPLLEELASRGHEVTVLGPYTTERSRRNIREIQTIDFDRALASIPSGAFTTSIPGLRPLEMAPHFWRMCSDTYDAPAVRDLLNEQFDLVLVPAVFNECASGYVYKFRAPVIVISALTVPTWISSLIGSPSPVSFVPNLFAGYDDRMSFLEMLGNLLVETLVRASQTLYIEPMMTQLYRDKLQDQAIPTHDEIIRNTSLILSNSHFALSKARPFLPDVIEVGGMHCKPAKPLPKDLAAFVNSSSSDGFIFFSMGTALKGSAMSEKYRQMFLRTFASLKQKVLWKWETEQMEGLPSNVKLSKWLPQQDILGHPKIKAFITHGGFGGITEAVCHGVPLVGIPMFGDQHLNMKKSVDSGFALSLEYGGLTEEKLAGAIQRVSSESWFGEKAKELSKIFQDQPEQPLDRAIFWTEYVLRHKGALHLKSAAARDLNFFQYHSLDVLAVLVIFVALILYIVLAIIGLIFRKICGSSSRSIGGGSKKISNTSVNAKKTN